MKWTVDYAESARQDLKGIFEYISETLLVPMTAAKQTDRIMDAADSLDNMPLRYCLFDKEPWRSHGFRIMPVDNYVVIYFPDEANNTVTVIRIMYGGRDIEKQLDETDVQM
jgi:toxin ParE1/3/4